jgi:tight adherence protein C
MTLILTIASFLVIAAMAFVLLTLLARFQSDPIRERLAASAQGTAAASGPGLFTDDLAESLAGQLPQTSNDNGALDRELRQAGYYRPSARFDYLALRNSLVIAALIITMVLALLISQQYRELGLRIVFGGLLVATLCWALPRVFLRAQARARLNRIRRALPYALDMMTMCLTGGLSLQDAIGHVSREIFFSHPDLAVELMIVRQQAEMTTLEHGFRQFASRMDIAEITALSALISQGQRLGTNVVTSIREYTDNMRLKWRQTADEQSNKIGLKLLFPITLCLLPATLIFIWGPAIVQMWRFLRNPDSIINAPADATATPFLGPTPETP